MEIPASKRFLDRTGVRYGRLLVASLAGKKGKSFIWNCDCDCGNSSIVHGSNLTSGDTTSCGCYRRQRVTKHGLAGSSEYNAYLSMKQRCSDKVRKDYKNYGGRGITVCAEWLESFEAFYKDMGDKPSKNHSIDRIDNDGNYTPDNCRWATASQQAQNKRVHKNSLSGVSGVYWKNTHKKWAASIGINNKKIYLGVFADINDAIEARKNAEIIYFGTYTLADCPELGPAMPERY